MLHRRKRADWLVVAAWVLAVVFVSLTGYVAGYFALSQSRDIPFVYPRGNVAILRTFKAKWQAKMFGPVAKIEERAEGKQVIIAWFGD